MYTEGQTLKITATKHNIYVPEGTTFTVTVVRDVRPDWDHEVRVQFSPEDARILNNRGRDQLCFAFKQILPTFYPDWTIEIVEGPAELKEAEAPAPEQSEQPHSREGWNAMWRAYGPMMPDNSYEEYLHNFFDSGLVYDQPQPAAPENANKNGAAISDDLQATFKSVFAAAQKQERIHPRDVSFIMDHLSVGQARAFVNHQGFPIDSFDQPLVWAVKLGLLLKDGKTTTKGRSFYQNI